MAINPNLPNSLSDVERYSQAVTNNVDLAFGRIGKLTVKDVIGGNIGDRLLEKNLGTNTSVLLESLINDLDRPMLKGLLMDTITVVGNWFDNPQVLCCLIQGIWAMHASSYSNTDLANLLKDGGSNIAGSNFAKWLDLLVSFVDLLISFIGTDIKKISIMIPDMIKEISNGVIGAVLLVLQEVLFTLRDSAIAKIIWEIDNAAESSLNMKTIWAKCVPFADLLDVIKKYVSDYGLFSELFEKIKGFVSGKVGDFGYMKTLNFPKNVKDLEFLYWFRELLIKLKQASINFDLCVNYHAAVPNGVLNPEDKSPTKTTTNDGGGGGGGRGGGDTPPYVPGLITGPNGTILSNNETQQEQRDNILPVLTNSSVRGFLNKYYGLPLDVVDNLLVGSSPTDSIHGTNINARNLSAVNADCPNSPTPEAIVRWALRVKNRNL